MVATWAGVVLGQVSPDFDGDGVVAPADISVFITTWRAELSSVERETDVDEDAVITPGDVARFIERWTAAIQQGYTPPAGPARPARPRAFNLWGSPQVLFAWRDESLDETGFEIVRQTRVPGATAYAKSRTFQAGPGTSSLGDSPGPGEHRYRVRAQGTAGFSAYSAWAYVEVGEVPGAPPLVGWTSLEPARGAVVWYVSSSEGSDMNLGTRDRPLRTLGAAQARMRWGRPDQMLLRRGDVWRESLDLVATGSKSEGPAVIGAYGSGPRPRIIGTLERSTPFESQGHLVISGVEVEAPSPGWVYGIVWQGGPDLEDGGGTDVTIEDCFVHHFAQNLVMQGMTGLRVRRCVITDAYSQSSDLPTKVGLYVGRCRDVLIEENLFDRNGFPVPGLFHHNAYIQSDCEQPVVFRRNIVIAGGATGVQLRPGGMCDDNLLVRNPIAITFGSQQGGSMTGTIRGNVVLEGVDLSQHDLRSTGIKLSNVAASGVLVERNIIARKKGIGPGGGIEAVPDHFVLSATIRDNIVYNWLEGVIAGGGGLLGTLYLTRNTIVDGGDEGVLGLYDSLRPMTFASNRYFRPAGTWFLVNWTDLDFEGWQGTVEPTASGGPVAFPQPERSLATYGTTLGIGGTYESVVAALRAQSRQAWNDDLSIDSLLAYFRGGFQD